MFDWSLIYFVLVKCQYKQRYIGGSVRSFTKPLPKLSTSIVYQVIKTRLQSYCGTCYIYIYMMVWIRCGFWKTLKWSVWVY